MTNIRHSIWIAAIAALGAGLGAAIAQTPATRPDTKGSEVRGGPELRLGKLDRPPGRSASLPVYFRAGQARNVGSISAQVAIPKASWIFQMAEAPQGAWWKVSSKEKGEERSKDSRGIIVVEVSFSAGNRALQDGLIGYLNFQVSPPGSPMPPLLSIRKVEVAAPSATLSKPGSPGEAPPVTPDQPTPIQSCFFFSH